MSKPILECNGIAAGYVKGLNILQGVDLVVSEGETNSGIKQKEQPLAHSSFIYSIIIITKP